MATFTNSSKNSTSYSNQIAKGREITLRELQDFTFEDDVFNDGRALKDIPFTEFVQTAFTNTSKSNTTFTNQSKN